MSLPATMPLNALLNKLSPTSKSDEIIGKWPESE